jgi:two-component system sensor histidine kinase KdpD
MSNTLTIEPTLAGSGEGRSTSPMAQYGASLLFVALAVGCGFILEPLVGAPNLTLVFVLPVMAAATSFGWGASIVATISSVLAFDFFFTEPRYSLAIARPADIWSAGLLLVIAAIASTIAAESRRRERAARRAAEQAQALQALAHVVIQAAPQSEIIEAAVIALSRIFPAPAVIFMQRAGAIRPIARAGGAEVTPADEEAAQGVLDSRLAARAETYPYHKSTFDFWPVETAKDCVCVIGVSFAQSGRARPAEPERFIEIVAAYLATALDRR